MPSDHFALAHNTERSGPNRDVPVIIENPASFPFAPGERDEEYHPASDEEYAAYVDYWNAVYDAEVAE